MPYRSARDEEKACQFIIRLSKPFALAAFEFSYIVEVQSEFGSITESEWTGETSVVWSISPSIAPR